MRSPIFLIDGSGAGRKAGVRARARFAVMLLLCLFAQWTISIGVIIETGDSRCCPTSGCTVQAAQPYCSMSLPPEDNIAIASFFYQTGILPAPAPALAAAPAAMISAAPFRIRAAVRAILRRPPR
jgi:hypothetical protein